jgi:hypothetical protein
MLFSDQDSVKIRTDEARSIPRLIVLCERLRQGAVHRNQLNLSDYW